MNTLENLSFANERAIIRVDFNVPLDKNGNVTDATRIAAAMPTIKYILDQGGSCVLLSHLGRPKGKDLTLSLSQIIPALEDHLGKKVQFSPEVIGTAAIQKAGALQPGEVLLMENLRFHEEETQGDEAFTAALANLEVFM